MYDQFFSFFFKQHDNFLWKRIGINKKQTSKNNNIKNKIKGDPTTDSFAPDA